MMVAFDGKRSRYRAFTLIEVMVAVLILALISMSAALAFSGPLASARFADARRMIGTFDHAGRQAAMASGKPVRLVFDFSSNTVSRREGRDLSRTVASLQLPAGVAFAEARIDGRAITDSKAIVDVSAIGLTRTYALRITGQRDDQWILIAGLSGEATFIRDTTQLDAIEQTNNFGTPRNHAD